MKKITLSLFAAVGMFSFGFSQVNLSVVAPIPNTSTQVRAPNGNVSHTAMRGCFIVQPSELTSLSLATTINSFGFSLLQGTSSVPVTGVLTLYLQNTTNTTYLKGTNWGTIPTGMTSVYSANMVVPVSNGTVNIILPITSFPYTGSGLYVAYDWVSTGPFDANVATYNANSTLPVGGATIDSPTNPAPTTLANTAFRPSFIFGAANNATNEVQVIGMTAPGKVASLLNAGHVVTSLIKNASNVALNNISVTMNVTGANATSANLVIPTLAAGATTNVSFPSYNPTTNGLSNIVVSVPADQNNSNNSATWTQSVTCNIGSGSPPTGSYLGGVGFNTGSGIIANRLIPGVNTNLTALRIAISSDANSVGNSVSGVLVDASGVVIATSNPVTITSAMAGVFQNFSFTSPQALTSGTTYYIGISQTANSTGYFPLGTQTAAYIPLNTSFQVVNGTLASISNNLGYFGIDAVYAPTGFLITASQSSSVSCKGDAVTLTASGMSSYAWQGAPTLTTGASIVVTPSVNTTYTVTGINVSSPQCPISETITHNVISFVVQASATKTFVCAGKPSVLNAVGSAQSYSWSVGTSAAASITVTPTTTTTYTMYGIEALAGCKSNVSSITVSVSTCAGLADNGMVMPEVKIFPNPSVSGKTTITGLSGVNTITVFNILGQAVITQQSSEENVTLDLGSNANGTYIVKIKDTNNDTKTVKIVNQN